MYWLVLFCGILLLSIALLSAATKGAVPPRRIAPQKRVQAIPAMILAGSGFLLESVPRLLKMPAPYQSIAGILGALILLGSAAIGFRQRRTTRPRG
jgi:hypothetical protein